MPAAVWKGREKKFAPALLTRMSRGSPNARYHSATPRTDSMSARSSRGAIATWAPGYFSLSSAQVRAAGSMSMQAICTVAPFFTNASAMCLPRPRSHPVTIATLPARGPSRVDFTSVGLSEDASTFSAFEARGFWQRRVSKSLAQRPGRNAVEVYECFASLGWYIYLKECLLGDIGVKPPLR